MVGCSGDVEVDGPGGSWRDGKGGGELAVVAEGSLSLEGCAPEIRHVLSLCEQAAESSAGYFTDHPGGRLDPSGMVKGWSVDVANDLLRRGGSRHHCITAGGDVRCTGVPESDDVWRIGIVDPLDPHRLLAFVTAPPESHLAVATSGTAERGHHIMDPIAGTTAGELASITVVATDLTTADWTATAAFAMGNECRQWLEQIDGVEAYAVTAHGDSWFTNGFDKLGKIIAEPCKS